MLYVFLSTYLVFNFHTALQPPTVQPPGKQDPIKLMSVGIQYYVLFLFHSTESYLYYGSCTRPSDI